ncbi:MAG: Flp pilus assembly protein CpaB [Pirellula sp.]|nr:Flp pilus assembly protein CpaB [Pirellula sp.]
MARISTGTMTVGIFAVLFGLAGAYALRAALTGPAPLPPAAPRTVSVPLATLNIPAGRQIVMADLALAPMTAEDMKSRKYNLDLVMLDTSQIIGRIVQTDIKQGEPILTTALYPQGSGPKLSDKLKPGMRALTIPIDNLAAVGGSTVEGCFVDVIFRSKKRDADMLRGILEIPATTVTLLENVEVLSVGRVGDPDAGAANGNVDVRQRSQNNTAGPKGYGTNYQDSTVVSVTIAVSPDQANVIKAVLGQGEMSLALRSGPAAADKPGPQGAATDAVTPNKYTLESILGVKHPTIASMDRIEIFRGSNGRQSMSFADDKLVKDEQSLVPGVPSGLTFPVPAQVPAMSNASAAVGVDSKTYRPTPNIFQGGGGWGRGGVGGYGGGFGGYGGAYDYAPRNYGGYGGYGF